MSSKRNNGLVIKEEIKSDNLGETDAGSMDFVDSFMEGKSLPRISQTINGGLIFFCLGFAFITLLVIAGSLFGKEKSEFFSWYFMIMLLGIINMPLTMLLTDRFRDSGWIVSKVIGIAFTGWLVWLLSSIKIATFSREKGIGFFLVGDATGDGGSCPEGYAVGDSALRVDAGVDVAYNGACLGEFLHKIKVFAAL